MSHFVMIEDQSLAREEGGEKKNESKLKHREYICEMHEFIIAAYILRQWNCSLSSRIAFLDPTNAYDIQYVLYDIQLRKRTIVVGKS